MTCKTCIHYEACNSRVPNHNLDTEAIDCKHYKETSNFAIFDLRDKRKRFSPEQQEEIRNKYMTENITQTKLAEMYGVSQSAICMIINPASRVKNRAYQREYIRKRGIT